MAPGNLLALQSVAFFLSDEGEGACQAFEHNRRWAHGTEDARGGSRGGGCATR
jgi:hypothetical protein